MSAPHYSVVVPVYDNQATLDELLDRLVAVMSGLGRPFEVILVDDGSRDGSLALLRRRAAGDARLRVLALARNFGGQSAICAGFDHVRGRAVICLDADLENLPEDVPALVAPLERGADLVCGVREGRQSPWLSRRLPSALLNAYVQSRLERSVRDIGCGMRALDARLVRNLEAEGEWRRFLTPLLLRRARHVVEVPVRHQPSPARGGHSFWSLLGIAGDFVLVSAGRPFLVLGVAALALAALGALVLLGALFAASVAGGVLGALLVAAGFAAAVAALAGEYAQRAWELQQDRPYYVLRELDPPAGAPARAVPDPERDVG